MDDKTRHLFLLTALSALCAGSAWSWDYPIFASVFFALTVIAGGSAAGRLLR